MISLNKRQFMVFVIAATTVLAMSCGNNENRSGNNDRIQPYSQNPYYWQYKGELLMPLGATDQDNPFNHPHSLNPEGLESHLDLLVSVGGNYIRNTMSSRDPENVQPFKQLENGKYDLDTWNDEYWRRFGQMLELTSERDIIVQIELWDQWDYNGGRWDSNPWNPDQNINYSVSDTKLKGDGHYVDVKAHLGQEIPLSKEDSLQFGAPHDFFLTVPTLNNDEKVLSYQQKFIDKILSYSLNYGNVLYVISNELFIQHPSEWSFYWADHITKKATEAGVSVYVTEMHQHHNIRHPQHKATFDHPEIFGFVDISQNSVKGLEQHWANLQWMKSYLAEDPRPVNHTKTYGIGVNSVPRFWNNIIGGAASCRFHRPGGTFGIGLNEEAQKHIKSMRMWLKEYDVFTSEADIEHRLMKDREAGEAFCSFRNEQQYSVFFPRGGEIRLTVPSGEYELRWLNIENRFWENSQFVDSDGEIGLKTPEDGYWLVLVSRADEEGKSKE